MICAGDEDEAFGVSGCVHYLFEFGFGSEPVAIAAEEELGKVAAGEERIAELLVETLGGKAECGEGMDVAVRCGTVAAARGESHDGAEAESDDDDGEIELYMKPVEGSGDIG
jgi:hypothetical protein